MITLQLFPFVVELLCVHAEKQSQGFKLSPSHCLSACTQSCLVAVRKPTLVGCFFVVMS